MRAAATAAEGTSRLKNAATVERRKGDGRNGNDGCAGNRRKADGYANRYEQRYGRKLRSLDARRRRGAARRGFQRERGVRLPCGRPVRHAENVVIRGVAGGNGRGACGVPRPGRIRAPLCGRVPRRTQGGRDVPDRRVGRHGAVGRRAGAVRETSWRAVQPDRPRRIAGCRRGRGYPQRGRIAGDTDAAGRRGRPPGRAGRASCVPRGVRRPRVQRGRHAGVAPFAGCSDRRSGRSGGARAAHGVRA